jgi:hypothetical protein
MAHYEHLAKEIPNNSLTRGCVDYINKKMKDSSSKYRLRIRYRVPKDGQYGIGGHVDKANSAAFSLYLFETSASIRATAAAKERLLNTNTNIEWLRSSVQ